MNRPSSGRRPKVRIGISPDPDLLEWVDERTGPGKRFATRTHAFEAGIAALAAQKDDPQEQPQAPLQRVPPRREHRAELRE
jgi:hypothetical protein